jgi:hypothetical protein
MRDQAQFIVDKRHQGIERHLVARTPAHQQLSDLIRGVASHEFGPRARGCGALAGKHIPFRFRCQAIETTIVRASMVILA